MKWIDLILYRYLIPSGGSVVGDAAAQATCREMVAAVVALLTSRKIPLSWYGLPVLTGDIQTDLEAFQRPGKNLAAAAVLLTQLIGTWTWALGEGIMSPADTTRYLEANWWHIHISLNSGIARGHVEGEARALHGLVLRHVSRQQPGCCRVSRAQQRAE